MAPYSMHTSHGAISAPSAHAGDQRPRRRARRHRALRESACNMHDPVTHPDAVEHDATRLMERVMKRTAQTRTPHAPRDTRTTRTTRTRKSDADPRRVRPSSAPAARCTPSTFSSQAHAIHVVASAHMVLRYQCGSRYTQSAPPRPRRWAGADGEKELPTRARPCSRPVPGRHFHDAPRDQAD